MCTVVTAIPGAALCVLYSTNANTAPGADHSKGSGLDPISIVRRSGFRMETVRRSKDPRTNTPWRECSLRPWVGEYNRRSLSGP